MIRLCTRLRFALLVFVMLGGALKAGPVLTHGRSKPLIAGINRDYPPFEFINSRGEPDGFDVELVQAVAAASGLEIRFRPDVWSSVRDSLASGKADLLAGMLYSRQRAGKFDFSLPHTLVNYSLFFRSGDKILRDEKDLKGKRILVERDSLMHDYMRQREFPSELIPVDSEPEALRLLSSGSQDGAIAPYIYGRYIVRTSKLENIDTSGVPLKTLELCFAVRKGDKKLLSLLNDGLSAVKASGRYRQIYDKWFGVLEPRGMSSGTVQKYLLIVVIPLLTLIFFGALWTWSLRKQVRARTEEIGNELVIKRKIEATLRHRLELENLITGISTRFISLPADKIPLAMEQALQELGRFMGIQRSYLFVLNDAKDMVEDVLEWCEEGVRRVLGDFKGTPFNQYPWFNERILHQLVVHIPCVKDLPEEAAKERDVWNREGVQSLLCVPIVYTGCLRGFIGFDSIRREMFWDEQDIRLLRMMGDVLSAALARKKSEEVLFTEKERLAVTLRSIADGVIATDTAGRIVLFNRAAEKITGWKADEAVGRPLGEVYYVVREGARRQGSYAGIGDPGEGFLPAGSSINSLLVSRTGEEKIVNDIAAPILDSSSRIVGVVLVFTDITEDRRIDEEIQKAQRLESIGLLAGGIAHDFNNFLTIILGNISLAKKYFGETDDLYRLLSSAEKATLRSRDLTRQLLTFSKGGTPMKHIASINEVIDEPVRFAMAGSSIKCDIQVPDDLWPVEIDTGQMDQVIQNLIINATQAMPEGGSIRIRGENQILPADNPLCMPGGKYVRVQVEDEGKGIEPALLNKIFDPYFTTKNKGSGLGLTTAYSIVKQHEGFLFVDSEVERGSVFTIYLPASRETVLVPSSLEEKDLRDGAGGRILLMDDDENIRKITRMLLENLGYRITTTADGAGALELYHRAREEGDPFDAVIMDLTVPGGMGGKECIKRLLVYDPGARAIVVSGYSNDPIMADYGKYGFRAVVPKPFKVHDLALTINRVIKGEG